MVSTPVTIDLTEPVSSASDVKDDVVSPSCFLPSLMDIFATSIPTVKRIPQQCRVPVAKAYTTVMRHCSTPNTLEQELRAWKLQFLFGKCVLRQQPEIRGGKKQKLKRNETLRTGLLERLKRWNEGKVDVIWAEACKLPRR